MPKTDLQTMLLSLQDSFPGIMILLTSAAYLMGIFFIFKAIYELKQYGEMRTMMASNTDLRTPIVSLLVGAVFIYLPTAWRMMLITVFGVESPLAYPGSDNSANWDQVVNVIVMFTQIIGLIAFIRGWLILAKVSSKGGGGGQHSFGKGLTHIIGGILAINVVGTFNVIGVTLGLK